MKKNLFVLLCCFTGMSLYGQDMPVSSKTVALYDEQTFYLNGGVRTFAGGQSRVTYKIELPPNTVEWYYSITVERNESKNMGTLNLLAQLTRLVDQTGTGAIVVSSLLTPTGSGVCDAFLLAGNSVPNFMAKREFNYDFDNSRTNYKNGTIKIIMKPGYINNFYIGFRNPSSTEGITVRFSAVALVAEKKTVYHALMTPPTTTIDNNKMWTKGDKNRIYNYLERKITHYCNKNKIENYSESDIKDIAAYFTDAITKTSKETFLELAEYEEARMLDSIIADCPKCIGLPSYIFAKAIER